MQKTWGLILAIVMSCTVMQNAMASDNHFLYQKEWVLEDIDGLGVIDNLKLTLVFNQDGRVSGFSGCNTFGGSYTTDEDHNLKIGPLMATMRACIIEAAMRQESNYLSALERIMSWETDEIEKLYLLDASGKRILQFGGENFPTDGKK